ncbi:sulfurtransferase [Pseudohongiella sp.]|uniref:Rhodanese domain-containing protein n=1 Tax=marine sediment metagenome TaxID=412755 RepID=A0A0F9WJT1_9ZZZZ|nr:sulfurtransferase [Pseudohongiella sp.]HDZ08128.1 sulfurtransferase [Pseudohongiella sp.]HEA63096.1 sulfurtransferase [Pseudohongiella sp.]
MTLSPLISVSQAAQRLADDDVLVFDVRFKLDDPAYGSQAYAESHVPGAVYLDLDKDLSSPIVPGVTGRHPLPDANVFEARMREIGLRKSDQVIVYDDGPGFYAARLWWLLTWLGHTRVRVLDGGLSAWRQAGMPMTAERTVRPWPGDFTAQPDNALLVAADGVLAQVGEAPDQANLVLLDARAPERFRGEVEPIDPVAGHIPGAMCLPCTGNLDAEGLFLSAPHLKARFPDVDAGQNLVCYCGSGVTACHNILAAVIAGLPMPRLYAGSWSEWITNPGRPVAVTGPEVG